MAFTEKYVSSLAGGSGDGLSPGAAFTFSQMVSEIQSGSGTGGRGKRYNIKADGTYTRTTYDSLGGSVSGTNQLPIALRGYKTTPGDGYLGRAADNGALIDTNMPFVNYTSGGWISGKFMTYETIRWAANAANDYVVSMETASCIFGCIMSNSNASTNSAVFRPREGVIAYECDITQLATSGPTVAAMSCEGNAGRILCCRIIQMSPTGNGVNSERWVALYANLIKGAGGGIGIWQNSNQWPFMALNNTIVGWTDAVKITADAQWASLLWGNMVTDNAGYGVNGTVAGNMIFVGPNRTRDNVLGDFSGTTAPDWTTCGRFWPLVTTDTGGPETDYANAAANDYNLVTASPGRQQNRPLWLDLGAYDKKDPVAGGGALFHPLVPFIVKGVGV